MINTAAPCPVLSQTPTQLRRMARRDAEDGGDGAWLDAYAISPRLLALCKQEHAAARKALDEHTLNAVLCPRQE